MHGHVPMGLYMGGNSLYGFSLKNVVSVFLCYGKKERKETQERKENKMEVIYGKSRPKYFC